MPFKSAKQEIKKLTTHELRNLLFLGAALFCLLFSYPIVRSTTGALFLNAQGAAQSPEVIFLSSLGLVLTIGLMNFLQKKFMVHHLFMLVGVGSFLFFGVGAFFVLQGQVSWAWPLFIWKEIYIVLLVGFIFAHFNNSINVNQAKVLFGPIGALGSFGGFVGGQLTSYMTKVYPHVEMIMCFGALFIFLAAVFFQFSDRHEKVVQKLDKTESPIASIKENKKYILMIVGMVALTQFIMFLAEFKFNLVFEKNVTDKLEKTKYFGQVFSMVGLVGLFFQLFIIPFGFKYFKTRNIHLALPLVFFGCLALTWFPFSNILLVYSFMLVAYKGMDYSIFSASKELLYFPLSYKQKYGAKYLVDMFAYRISKGFISFIFIFYKSEYLLNAILYSSLVGWFLLLFPLFHYQQQIKYHEV